MSLLLCNEFFSLGAGLFFFFRFSLGKLIFFRLLRFPLTNHGLMVSLGDKFVTAASVDAVTVGSLRTGQLTLKLWNQSATCISKFITV